MEMDPPYISPRKPDAAINHQDSINYWSKVSSDVHGMLGGYPQTSRIDLQGSANFLAKLRRKEKQRLQHEAGASLDGWGATANSELEPLDRVADCGAGIGRITRGFLVKVAKKVDVVEPVKKFTDELAVTLKAGKKEGQPPAAGVVGEVDSIINLGLQDWTPTPGTYNVIWNQWCLGHLTDAQLVTYLQRCRAGLVDSPASLIVVKENISTDSTGQDIFDPDDSSVTRTDNKFRQLFRQAKLKLVTTEIQRGFPKELFPVRMYALRPEE